MIRAPALVLICVLLAALPACGADVAEPDDTASSASASSTTSSSSAAPTAAVSTDSTTTSPVSSVAPGIEVIEDVEYHGPDDRFRPGTGVLDVYRPRSGGPHPVIVIFHGDPRSVGKEWVGVMAEELAARHRVVVAPNWGKTTVDFAVDAPLAEQWDTLVHELRCAMAFVFARADSFGGDPASVTVAGYSAGGNAAMMAALSDLDPLDSCVAAGPIPPPMALVPMEADMLIGAADWDGALSRDPEAFYSLSPWRDLSDADDFPVHIVVAELTWNFFNRSVGDDPYASFLADRHADIDLIAELTEMGELDDGTFSPLDAQRWAYQTFDEAGYDVDWTVLPDTRHALALDERWGMTDEAWEIAIETLLNAGGPR